MICLDVLPCASKGPSSNGRTFRRTYSSRQTLFASPLGGRRSRADELGRTAKTRVHNSKLEAQRDAPVDSSLSSQPGPSGRRFHDLAVLLRAAAKPCPWRRGPRLAHGPRVLLRRRCAISGSVVTLSLAPTLMPTPPTAYTANAAGPPHGRSS